MMKKIVFTVALLLSGYTTNGYAGAKEYAQCAKTKTELYSYYCYQVSDIILAVRGTCRQKIAGIFDEENLRNSDKSKLIETYLTVQDEQIAALVLDGRITNKIDCGQFNSTATPDLFHSNAK